MKAWEEFLREQQKELGADVVEKWLRPLKVLDFDAGNLYLEAQDSFQATWFEEHLRPQIKGRLHNSNQRPIKVHVSVASALPQKKGAKEKGSKGVYRPVLDLSPDTLDPLATFEQFISTAANEVPYKLITGIDGHSAPSFNPLFIHGGSGSGKTHLLMALAHALQARGRSVFYIRAETFTQHVVSAIRNGAMQELRKIYRNLDLLLIDEAHHFARKNATQEEFFHTFNALHTTGKQIVLAAHSPPHLLAEIEPRLISRFEWGIVLPLEKLGKQEVPLFLNRRADAYTLSLGEQVSHFLQEAFQFNPKSLDRALQALSLRGSKKKNHFGDVEAVKLLLSDLIEKEKEQALTPHKIVKAVADYYGIKSEDILGKAQHREASLPRQIAMFFCRQELKLPFLKIGEIFGRDHSTVMASVKQIQEKIDAQESETSSAHLEISKKFKF